MMKINPGSHNEVGLTHKNVSTDQAIEFVHHFSHAINNNEMRIHFQPRFNLASGKADIFEALVRWNKPGIGLFYPEVFISDTENNGLIYTLDLWVFEQCCKDLKIFHQKINSSAKIAVNISVLACESLFYAQKIIEISEKYRINLADFEFEITETTHTHDIRKVIAFCKTLIQYGAKFSLDDFGTSQSPLINLCTLPIKTLKIDKSFIQNIGHSKRCESMIRLLTQMAREMNIVIVAEGIETRRQYHFIQDQGCDQGQGFLLCRPVSINKLTPPMLYISS